MKKYYRWVVYRAKVGSGGDSETMENISYKLNDAFRIWDTPGLGDGIEKDKSLWQMNRIRNLYSF